MSHTLDFYFDFGSPTSYLAYKQLLHLQEHYGLEIVFKPILLGGIFKSTGNASPITIPAKGKYMVEQDMPRFAERYGVTLNTNPYFPINTLPLMRGAIAAERLGCFASYTAAIFDAMWAEQKNMGELDVINAVLTEAGLDSDSLMALSQDPEVKAGLIANTEAAVERGVFGAPTFFMGEAMFFGQDRLDFIEEALKAS